MRARYYNIDYRRFVNADVIAGNISNAVTLNRYAYANGNPVSLIDPFGLKAQKKVDITKAKEAQVEKHTKNTSVEEYVFNRIIKIVENRFLRWTVSPWGGKKFDNYEHNHKHDKDDGDVIESQSDDISNELKLGNAPMQDTGCEVIAVYNAMILSGMKDVSLADIIEVFQDEGALIGQAVLQGTWGSNPYEIGNVLDEVGLDYRQIYGLGALKKPGLYIVSVWNTDDVDSMIHTFTVEVSSTGELHTYNGEFNDNQIFITGYKINSEGEKVAVRK